eukprot:CAMPEP_0196588326 /NCGR_PEP_ID=MMETSP1081-20130531/60268_1 /TAXON_ID=36882 /ORGANISM="Pyramimonas amylifera, Strain CCMP720" /LENGTH=62 /DNA_ID=CAMNT_0041910795 /DNA_START=15 /DNA_END=199 /DNA_ORIENTATION=-
MPPQTRFRPGDVLALTQGGGKPVIEGEAVLLGLVLERSGRLVRVTVTQETAWRMQESAPGGG